MNTQTIATFDLMDEAALAGVEGGVNPLIGVFVYGIVVGYTNEKCQMDNGNHWYCMRIN